MIENTEKIQVTNDQSILEDVASFTSDDSAQNKGHTLQRGLKARHISMIALGGTIGNARAHIYRKYVKSSHLLSLILGTGLFMSSGASISNGGPGGTLVAYGLIGILVFCVMMSLGEMAAYLPIAGSFNHFATRFADPSLGFMVGWIYWANWSVGVAAELTGVSLVMEYWITSVNSVVWAVICLVILVALNVFSVKGYGEFEYWISFVKILVVIIFIIVGICVDTGAAGGVYYGVSNFHLTGGAFPNGFLGVFNVFISAAYSFNGVEIVGITAGESVNPHKSVPLAVKQVFFRIILFYILSLLIIGLVIPYTDPNLLNGSSDISVSPFTLVFEKSGAAWAANMMNAIILVTMVSAGNSGVYSSSRTLLALSNDGFAPRFFSRVNKWGIPLWSVLGSCLIGCVAFLMSLFGSGVVFNWLVNLTALAGLITWVAISITHLRFRQGYIAQGRSLTALPYVAPFFPYGDWIVIIVGLVVILGQGYSTFIAPIEASSVISSYIGLILAIVLYAGHKIWKRPAFVKNEDMDFETGTFQSTVIDIRDDNGLDANGNPLPKWRKIWNKIIDIIA